MHSNASGWDNSFVLKQLKDSFAKLKIQQLVANIHCL